MIITASMSPAQSLDQALAGIEGGEGVCSSCAR